MKRLTLFILVNMICFLGVKAQSYTTTAGVRLGTGIGITVQQVIAKELTVEGILSRQPSNSSTAITLMLEKHNPFISRRFNFYYGGGFHKGWLNASDASVKNPGGVSLVAGVEFTIGKLNLSWDYKPQINIWGGERAFNSQSAISLRYVLVKRKRKKINWKFWEKK